MKLSLTQTTLMPSRASGFSLIELMVVVAIIGIIGFFAYPSYLENAQKSRRADAKIALTEASARQERIYTQNGSYAGNSDIAKLVSNADGVSSPEGFYKMSVDTSACSSDGSGPFSCFTMVATAQNEQALDTACATIKLSHLGQKTSTGGGTCW